MSSDININIQGISYMTEERKPLGFWTLTSLVLGNMVGTGIFLLPTNLAKEGSIGLIGLGIAAIGATLLAFILSKLSQVIQKDGGPYAYAKSTLGNFVGFQTVYCHWFSMWVALIAITLELAIFLAVVLPVLSDKIANVIFCITILWIFTAVNLSSIRTIKTIQIVTVILKILPLILFIVIGILYFHPDYLSNNFIISNNSNGLAISNTAAISLWAFIGLESATIPYNLVENPTRNIPLATLVGTIFASLLYILCSTVVLGVLPIQTIITDRFPFALAAQSIFGNWGRYMILIGAVISCIGSLNGWLFIQGQLTRAAALDGIFPKIFGNTNRYNSPSSGILLTAILITAIMILALLNREADHINIIITMASMAALIPYIYSCISALIVSKEENLTIKTKDIFFTFAFLATIYSLWMIISITKEAIFYGTILIFVSAVVYALQFKESS